VSKHNFQDPSSLSMLELFRVEAENQAAVLTTGLLELERGEGAPRQLETLMRAAHSLKGAARIVNLQVAVRVAHAMEDCFVLAQEGKLALRQPEIDQLFRGVDLLLQISKYTETSVSAWETDHAEGIREFLKSLAHLTPAAATPVSDASQAEALMEPAASGNPPAPDQSRDSSLPANTEPRPLETHSTAVATRSDEKSERVVRLAAENLNRLLGIAGESLVESRWLRPFSASLQRLKRQHADLSEHLDVLRQRFTETDFSGRTERHLNELARKVTGCQQFLADRLQELDLFDRRSAHLSQRMYLEVLRTRMRPFSDGVRHFPRMVRDLARAVGKQVQLEIIGENTPVDRDILEQLESPLAHLLRNAVDHGCEYPEERQRAGKSSEGTIRLEARHSAGMLLVTVTDDGAGVQPERVRETILKRKLATPAVADRLTEAELFQFLLLPGFTLKEAVTEISGRGVGLDVVQNMVRGVRGNLRISKQPGPGLRVQLQLPLTLSVLRTLLVEVAGEPYAFPLTQIARALKLQPESIETLESRHHFTFDGQQVGLLAAHQLFECRDPKPPGHDLPVVVLGDRDARYGLVVDRFLGERELVVQPLDPRLGKVKDISAAALMEDGAPVLIVDVDDMVRSIEKLLSEGRLTNFQHAGLELTGRKQKRVLAVDDSLTVRELVRKLLANRGYLADVAVDGMDGWNAVRTGHYDLVITDVDMPRLDGIELAALIKKDPELSSVPVMIVSYKDREEDRLRGLEAGADYYLTKGSFHDETLLQAVVDLIGDPDT
jgi:two-component system, chemotaxis family, sensor histidine kinase and response regulator WspE